MKEPDTPDDHGMKLLSANVNMVNAFVIIQTDDNWTFATED